MPPLKTHKPSGMAPWPLILLTGEPGAGKSYSAAEFTGSDQVGRCFWLDLGEGCGEEYGEVPGADYEIVEHDGTWVSIIGQVEAVKDEAKRASEANEPPVVLVIDSMTHEWAMLSEWTDKRARRQKGNIGKLKEDPDAEIDITMNLWNDANSRHNRLMNLVKTFPGIVVLIASEKEVAQLDKGGNPVRNGPKEWKPEGQKFLSRDCTVWVRLLREDQPTVVKCRSVHYGIRPGVDRPKKVPDFTLDWLVFELLKCNSKTRARPVSTLDADQVMPEEAPPPVPDDTETNGSGTTVRKPNGRDWLADVKRAEDAKDLSKLTELWVNARGDKNQPPVDEDLLDNIAAAARRVKRQQQMNHLFALLDDGGITSSDEDKPRRLRVAQNLLARGPLTTYAELSDAEVAEFVTTLTGLKKVGTLTQRLTEYGADVNLRTAVDEILSAHTADDAADRLALIAVRTDAGDDVAHLLTMEDKEALGLRDEFLSLLVLAEKGFQYTEKHGSGPRVLVGEAA